ncbi:hypothetical protein BHE74_00052896 [Ensete ventricosum]|nr:hypothetical protein GW17_00001943 [Ensete ventricosum]RWW41606.1 hypothetical protein BHE74_00052896 [Ensete ventricosum]RZS21783.1 hypothetical protein BHM03_00054470 [Ensete ventricosum]
MWGPRLHYGILVIHSKSQSLSVVIFHRFNSKPNGSQSTDRREREIDSRHFLCRRRSLIRRPRSHFSLSVRQAGGCFDP